MTDVFDQLDAAPKAAKGDVFDQLDAAPKAAKGDVFDQLDAAPKAAANAIGIAAGHRDLLDTMREMLFGGPEGETVLGRAFPAMNGARQTDTPTVDLPAIRFELTLGPQATPADYAAYGVNQVLSSLTTPKNLALLAGTAGLGAIVPPAGYPSVAAKLANSALGAYFSYQMAQGATDAMKAAYAAHQQGNDDEAARLLGYGGVTGLLAAAGLRHARESYQAALQTQVPKPARKPDVLPAEETPGPEPLRAAAKPTINVKSTGPSAPDIFDEVASTPAPTAPPAPRAAQTDTAPSERPSSSRPYGSKPSDYVPRFVRTAREVGAALQPPVEPTPTPQPEPTPLTAQASAEDETGKAPANNYPQIGVTTEADKEGGVGSGLVIRDVPVAAIRPMEDISGLTDKRQDAVRYAQRMLDGSEPPPLAGQRDDDGNVLISTGSRRLLAAQLIGRKTLPVAMIDEPPVEQTRENARLSAPPQAHAPAAPVSSPVANPVANPSPEPAHPPQSSAPSGVVNLPTAEIHADPARFQFKADTGGAAGVGDELKQIRTFNPDLAGVISVWRDPADGKTYVINGHHRLELAKRTRTPQVSVRYIQAANAGEARQTGALINIAEGRGTAIDAAKVFRESNLTPEQVEEQRGVSLRGAVARDGVALSRLAPSIFDRVVQGDLPVQRAAMIGETLPDHDEQKAALALLDKADAQGKGLNNAEARELIRFVKEAPRAEQQAANFSLFGEDTITKNLALEKAEVSSYIKQELAKTKKLFSLTGTLKSADVLGKTGNVIKAEENARMAEATAQVQAVYDKLSLSAGPISDALDQAARELAEGHKPAAQVKQHALERVRQAVRETFSRTERTLAERGGGASESGSRVHGATPEAETGELAAEPGRSAGEGIPDSVTRRGAGENVAARPPGADEEPITGRIPRSGGRPAPDRDRSLFDPAENDAVASDAARDRDQLEGERLTAQLNAPLTREEQLKKLKRSKDKPQQNLFEEEEPPAQGSFFLGSGLGALQPYVEKFIDGKLVPTARQAAEALAVGKKEVLKALAPGSLPGAAVAHNIVRMNAAELARSTDIAEAALRVAGKYFRSLTPEANYAFMDRMERGVAQADEHLDAIAKVMRTLLDGRRDAVRDLGTGKLDRFVENYFPHIWQNTPEAQRLFANFAKRPLEGAKHFLEERTIDTIAQGLELGLKPVSDNPVDLVLLKLREMDKYLMAHRTLADLQAAGQLQFHPATSETPEGYRKIDDKVATVYVSPSRAGAVQVQGYWTAPEPAARILNNYLSPGLRDKSVIFRSLLGVNNVLNQAQLGLSAYHLAFTSLDVAVSKLALGIFEAAQGDVRKGLLTAAQTPLAPFVTMMRGDKMLKEWYAPGTQGARIAELVDAAVAAGGRAHMDTIYQTKLTDNMLKAWRAGNVLGAAGRLPFALIEQAARLIMEYVVPRQKMGVFADLAAYELERLGPDANDHEVRAALARAWDSVDNRLGELVYDNLAWNKIVKDVAMLNVRSVGWNVGTIREVGGGYLDALRFAGIVGGKALGKGADLPMRKQGDPWSLEPPAFTLRMSYVLALHMLQLMLGLVAGYLLTGHAPKKLRDYFFPLDARGNRWTPPSYLKDEWNWATDPVRTARGKVSALDEFVVEELSQKDFFEKPIRNPHDPLVKQAEDEAKYVLKQFIPIGLRPDPDQHPRVPSAERRALGFVGITPAPKSLDELGSHSRR